MYVFRDQGGRRFESSLPDHLKLKASVVNGGFRWFGITKDNIRFCCWLRGGCFLRPFDDVSGGVIPKLCCRELIVLHGMSVDVESDLAVCVAESFADDRDRHMLTQ